MQPPVTAHRPVGMQPPITARRLVAGDGERKSSLLLELTSSWARPVRVDVVDELPHWVQPYWHTLRCWRNGTSVSLDEALSRWRIDPASAPAPPLPRAIELYSNNAVATRAPHQFRWSADLPAGPTSLVVAFDILKPVRHIDSMPADASRGLDIGSAAVAYSEVASISSSSISSSSISSSAAVAYSEVAHAAAGAAGAPDTAPPPQMLLFSNAVVVMLPIADDSMPYNVIAVSSTLIALFVGQMFNLLMRPLTGRGKAKAERRERRVERGRGAPLKTRFV
jgi:phosphatidylinositol glycan class T